MFGESFWYMAPILMAATTFLSGAIIGLFKTESALWKQVTSWIVAAILSVGSYFLGIVSLTPPVWLGVVMLWVVVGLSSNGIYDIPTIKEFVEKLFKYKTITTKQ